MENASVITELVKDIAINGNMAAYKKLYLLLYPAVKRFALCFLRSPQMAEEVASDVLITLWQKRDTLMGIQNIKVYAYVIAKNQCLNLIKQNSSTTIISLDEVSVDLQVNYDSPEQMLINNELGKSLNAAIESLPPRCKMIFKLIKQDGLSYREVAEVLEISTKTVDAQLVIAVKRLSVCIAKEFNLAI